MMLRIVSLHAKKKLRDRGVSVWWDRKLEAWVAELKEFKLANKEYRK